MANQETYDAALAHAKSLDVAVDTLGPLSFIVWDANDYDDCKYGYAVDLDHQHADELGLRCVMVYAEDGMPIDESREYHADLEDIIDRMDDVVAGEPYVYIAA